jgi:hypothetical protein
MEQITKWKSDDGCEFTNLAECMAYETLCTQVDQIMMVFPKRPENDGCSFANGGGFIQLSEEIVKKARGNLLDLIATKIDHKWVMQSKDMNTHPSYVARLVGDWGIKPFCQAWDRFNCIDPQWREWGQPYYASHPDEGKQIMVASAL